MVVLQQHNEVLVQSKRTSSAIATVGIQHRRVFHTESERDVVSPRKTNERVRTKTDRTTRPQGTNTSRTPAGNVGQTTGLEGAMADMAVQPSNRGDTQGPRATTAKDPITGVETSWEIGTSTQDAINYKRVRERSTTAIEGEKLQVLAIVRAH